MQHRPNEFLVIEAKDGDQGIRYALDHQPDLIICDIMMPHVDGYEAFPGLFHSKNALERV